MYMSQEQFVGVFSAAFPFLNFEDRTMLVEMARLWASRNTPKPSLRLVVGGHIDNSDFRNQGCDVHNPATPVVG
jgi:hypothetical protein